MLIKAPEEPVVSYCSTKTCWRSRQEHHFDAYGYDKGKKIVGRRGMIIGNRKLLPLEEKVKDKFGIHTTQRQIGALILELDPLNKGINNANTYGDMLAQAVGGGRPSGQSTSPTTTTEKDKPGTQPLTVSPQGSPGAPSAAPQGGGFPAFPGFGGEGEQQQQGPKNMGFGAGLFGSLMKTAVQGAASLLGPALGGIGASGLAGLLLGQNPADWAMSLVGGSANAAESPASAFGPPLNQTRAGSARGPSPGPGSPQSEMDIKEGQRQAESVPQTGKTGVDKIMRAAQASTGLSKGVRMQCANTTRSVLAAAGHPDARRLLLLVTLMFETANTPKVQRCLFCW